MIPPPLTLLPGRPRRPTLYTFHSSDMQAVAGAGYDIISEAATLVNAAESADRAVDGSGMDRLAASVELTDALAELDNAVYAARKLVKAALERLEAKGEG